MHLPNGIVIMDTGVSGKVVAMQQELWWYWNRKEQLVVRQVPLSRPNSPVEWHVLDASTCRKMGLTMVRNKGAAC